METSCPKGGCKNSLHDRYNERLKHFLPAKIMKTLYNSLILPHITYGIILWGKVLKRINKLQKWAIRTIDVAKYNAHTEPIFKRLKLLKAQDIYKLTAIKIFHKYKNDKLPGYFNGMFEYIPPTHNHNTRNRNNRRDTPSTISASHSPRFTIPKIIDTLDEDFKDSLLANSLNAIARNAKFNAIDSYNDSCTVPNCYVCNCPNTSLDEQRNESND